MFAAATRTPNSESLAMIVAGFGWPVVYFCLSMAWLASVAATTEPIGPGKELHEIVIRPVTVSIILHHRCWLFGLIGVLPTSCTCHLTKSGDSVAWHRRLVINHFHRYNKWQTGADSSLERRPPP